MGRINIKLIFFSYIVALASVSERQERVWDSARSEAVYWWKESSEHISVDICVALSGYKMAKHHFQVVESV